ncbi:MAG: hypothetical protein HYZ15_11145 [Sphingobacteriales bacterium]|nr:hypothetical protein [Sphingobacteriales bacterium]
MKKIKPPEKKAGIWLDQETAYIIHLEDEAAPVVEKLVSGVESRIRVPGEGKVMARFGQSFLNDQEKKQQRQRNQRQHFFKNLIAHLQQDQFLYLFGPGKAKEGLNNVIEKEKGLAGRVTAIETTDKLTRKGAMQQAVSYFNGEAFRIFKKNRKKALKAAG